MDTLDPKSSAIPFVQKAGITYPVGTDDGQVSSGLYGIYGDPQTFFIDAKGTVIGHVARGAETGGAGLLVDSVWAVRPD